LEKDRKARRKHPVFCAAMNANKRRMNLKLAGISIGIVIVLIMGGIVFIEIDHNIHNAYATEHKGVYFSIESASFVNSSGSCSFVTTVKNTGSVFINTINITVPATGSTVGQLTSISVGITANGSFQISGVQNGTLYSLEYYGSSGNLSYETMIPVTG
jgi:hypothetical protein